MSETQNNRKVDRRKIVPFLDGLDGSSLTRIVVRLEFSSYRDVPNQAHPERVSALLAFVEGSAGPGLHELALIVMELFQHDFFMLYSPNSPTAESAEAVTPQQITLENLVPPGGAVAITSAFYVPRIREEQELLNAAYRERGIAILKSPRQTGKTTLLYALEARVQGRGSLRTVTIDFQMMEKEDFETARELWRATVKEIANNIGITGWESRWQHDDNSKNNLNRFFQHYLFFQDETPVLICLDEIDVIFRHPDASNFFLQLRAFYNAGARDRYWKRIRWAISTSAEPRFFIPEGDGSPFNIVDASQIELNAFTETEVRALAARYGVVEEGLTERIIEYVAGRPYLTHTILYHLARGDREPRDIWDAISVGGGIFRNHLRSYLKVFQKDSGLREAMLDIVQGRGCENDILCSRLESAGLVHLDSQGIFVPTCRLYREYFGTLL